MDKMRLRHTKRPRKFVFVMHFRFANNAASKCLIPIRNTFYEFNELKQLLLF